MPSEAVAAPVSAPVATPAPVEYTPPPADPTAPAAPADYHPSMDDAAGLAVYRAARKTAPAAPVPPDPDVSPVGGSVSASPPESTPATTAATTEDLSPEDAKLARILNRISRLEDERNAAQRTITERETELGKLRERAKFAEEYERDLAEFHEDPERLFKRVKWDQAKIQDYVVNGPSKVDAATERVSRETADLKARLEKFERAEAERTQTARINDFKATLPAQLDGKKSEFPHVLSFYESPHELADALFGIMESTYRTQQRELTVEETAKVLESTLSGHYERLNRARSQAPAPADSAAPSRAPKPSPAPTLTNTPPAASKPPTPSEDDDDSLLASAAAYLRTKRNAAVV